MPKHQTSSSGISWGRERACMCVCVCACAYICVEGSEELCKNGRGAYYLAAKENFKD